MQPELVDSIAASAGCSKPEAKKVVHEDYLAMILSIV
jgi:hypothetical protein